MTLTLDAARAIVRQPGLHLSEAVDAAIDRMMRSPDWTDQNEATALQRAISREGRPVRHDEAHDFRADDVIAHDAIAIRTIWPQAVMWIAGAALVYSVIHFGIPLIALGFQTAGRFAWGL